MAACGEGATDGEEDPVSGGLTGPGVAGDVLGGRSGIEALEGLAVADFRLLVEADDEAGADGGALRVGHHVDQLAQEGATQGADPVGRPQLAEALLAVVLPVAQGEQGAEKGLALLLAFALVLLALLELGKPGAGVLAQLGKGIPEAVGIEHLVATAPRLFPILEAVFEEFVLLVLTILRVLVTDVFPQRFMEELVVVYVLGEVVFVEELLGGGQHLVLDVVEREAQQAGHHLIGEVAAGLGEQTNEVQRPRFLLADAAQGIVVDFGHVARQGFDGVEGEVLFHKARGEELQVQRIALAAGGHRIDVVLLNLVFADHL